MSARVLPILSLLLLGGCYDQPMTNGYGSTTPRSERPATSNSTLGEAVTPVRIGELGRNFAACNAQGEVRASVAEEGAAVRAAPFDQARQKGSLAAGARFFICSRSLDQRWFGIVYEAPGRAGRVCGVSAPVSNRQDYSGPCDSGWVGSAQVRLISGVEPPADEPSGNVAEPK